MKQLQLITNQSHQIIPNISALFYKKENQITFNAKPVEIQTWTNFVEVLTFRTKLVSSQIDENQELQNIFQLQNSLLESFYGYKYDDGLPVEIHSFIEEFKMPKNTPNLLIEVMTKISDLLNSKNLQHTIMPELFVDYEYPEWKKIKLRVIVSKDLNYLYDNIKYPIYDLVDNSLPSELNDNILIKIESFKENDTTN